jgi:hypothetical protein
MRRRLKVNTAMTGLAALMLYGTLAAGSPAASLADAGSPAAGSVCQAVTVKVRATHWVWLKETRKVHGRRVFVRRHGKIVLRHVRVSYLKAETEQVCPPPSSAVLTPPSPVAPTPPVPTPPAPPAPGGTVPSTQPPTNTGAPFLSGTPRSGQALTAEHGNWSGSPTGYAYQWQLCDKLGENCSALSGATSNEYPLTAADVGKTLRVSVIASNAGGNSASVTSAQSAEVTAALTPTNTSPPTIGGNTKSGQTLTATLGAWSGSPSSYAYAWQRCDSAGESCEAISGASASTYLVVDKDVGGTLRVAVTATNSAGPSASAPSAQTPVVAPATVTFGTTTVGPHADLFSENRKRVNSYTMSNPGLVSKLSIYLQPSGTEGEQKLKGLIYSDSGGKPNALLGVSSERVYKTSEPGGWYGLTFPSPLSLAAGKYWIGIITGKAAGVAGYRFETVFGSREANENLYTEPTKLFGTGTPEFERMSLYATYTTAATSSPPVNTELPTISGVAESGQHLSAVPGTWSESPTYTYQWLRCNSSGGGCSPISGATSSTYTLGGADVSNTVKVSVTAANPGGSSTTPSAVTPVVISSSGAHHLEYVFNVGLVSVYDIDQGWKSAGTISLPQTEAGIRGVMVSPGTHMMFVAYGGDSGGNGNGSVLAYDLGSDQIKWEAHLNAGIDSGAVSPDGKTLYMPTGEQSTSGTWNIINAENGAVTGTIEGGLAPHNTIASQDGKYVYLGGRYGERLDVYDTATGKVVHKIGPFGPVTNGVRPFTVNGSNTIAFTTATEFDGFQVSSVTKETVLSTIPFQSKEELQEQKEKEEQEIKEGKQPVKYPDSGYSHGISLSPNEKELYVVDALHQAVRVYSVPNVTELEAKVAPTELAVIPMTGEELRGTENLCAYDCGRGGWLQRSTAGRFVVVGDSGAVIDTSTKTVVATLPTLLNTKISTEIDWESGSPVATSGRTGVGEVP